MPQISCTNLTLGYEGSAVLTGLSFTVNAGDYLCIIGENGSGKSTLFKALLGLKAPAAGRIALGDGLKLTDIGYLPQQTLIQKDFPATVNEVVRSGCLNRCGWRPFYNKEEKQSAADQLTKLGIAHLAKRCYRDLSGGQQQRALLARALNAARKVLLLDEPAAGLDPHATQEMYALIAGLNQAGLTVLMISHDFTAASKDASHLLHLGDGGALFFGVKAAYPANVAGSIYANAGGASA